MIKKIILSTFCIFFIFTLCYAPTFYKARVVDVHDGDTFTIKDRKGRYKIRLWGIDAPEYFFKNSKSYTQAFALESKDFLSDLILNKNVDIVYVNDNNGRIVGTVTIGVGEDKINVNEKILEAGLAWLETSFITNNKNIDETYGLTVLSNLTLIYEKAKSEKNGMWINKNNIRPSEFRKNPKMFIKNWE